MNFSWEDSLNPSQTKIKIPSYKLDNLKDQFGMVSFNFKPRSWLLKVESQQLLNQMTQETNDQTTKQACVLKEKSGVYK